MHPKINPDVLLLAWFCIMLILCACWCRGQQVLLDMGSYTVLYDSALRVPVTADWLLIHSFLGSSLREPSWRFKEDGRVPRPRATHQDYNKSGFDRGHMCPAADRSASRDLMRSTFIMTNVCPQTPALNRGPWKKLEEACRSYARNGHDLRIVAEAVFWPADTMRIGRDSVAVPHGFVKTVRTWPGDSIIFSKYFPNL